jgi:hypothetical protein
MAEDLASLRRGRWGETLRRDRWWLAPAWVFLALSSFVVYATWAAFQNAHYEFENYLSPFYSPVLWGDSHHSWFGNKPDWWPGFLPFSPALLILPIPAGFRLTCYYYRGAYYKAFWADPPACAVGEPRGGFRGENSLPLILQNVHRYFLYLAVIIIAILAFDAFKAFFFDDDGDGHFESLGIGVGTIVLCLNVYLLSGYTFGCHSLRHLIGGYRSNFSAAPFQTRCYNCVSNLNRRHMLWAWCSLVWVAFSDIYVRLCSMGIWTDFRITL